MKVNIDNDLFFIDLVKNDILKVYKDGRIKNRQTGNYIGAKNNKGYVSIGFKHEGKVKHILVHRLVYIVYKYRMRPLPFIVNHKDGVKDNNYYRNLERSNNSHNIKHAWNNKLINVSEKTIERFRSYVGENNPVARLTNEEASKIRTLYSTGNFSYRSLARKYDMHHSQICRIIKNQTYCE